MTQVVFAATPHTGARQATLLDRLRFFAWPSTIARTLVANNPTLRSINVAYRGFADERRDLLQHRVFYETLGTPAGVIVDEASAYPGLPGDPPVPVDADHISIVKPFHRYSVLYARTRDFSDLAGALKSHKDSLAIADRLATSDPGNAHWQYDLGISNERIGSVQMAQGKLADALKSYRAKQEIKLRLATSDPGNAGWQRDLSVSYNKIGDVQVAQGDLAGALKSYKAGRAILGTPIRRNGSKTWLGLMHG